MGVRFTNLGGSDQVIRYYTQRGMEAYYSENQEFNGYWAGKAAAKLGLEGPLTKEAFARLARNQHPLTGEKLTDRMAANRRSAFDITFDVPKSVSLAYAYTKDDRVMQAIRQAARETLAEMELRAATRVRAGEEKNSDRNRVTGNWVAAEIVHLTARPEGGFPDPHSHVHMVVFNVTYDEQEGKWKALQMRPIRDESTYYQNAFHMRLKENLQRLGLEVENTELAFELEGYPRGLTEKFSRRTQKINETAERLGITDPEMKAKLGALTRDRKNKNLTLTELEPLWWSGLSEEHKAVLEGTKRVLGLSRAAELTQEMVPTGRAAELFGTQRELPVPEPERPRRSSDQLGTRGEVRAFQPGTRRSQNQRTRPVDGREEPAVVVTEHDRRAVRLAMEHLFERRSVVSELELIGEAYSGWCVGRATRAGILKVVREEANLLWKERDDTLWVTTPEVKAEEDRIRLACWHGRGKFGEINQHWQIEDTELNLQQREAVRHVLTSKDFIIGIAGKAGSGKTRLLTELRQGLRAGLCQVVALAPSGKASRTNLRKEGFREADTVARFLVDEQMQRSACDGVIIVDEAGLLSARQADRLIETAQRLNARLVLVGDTGQHRAVERGQAFDLLRRCGGMSTVEVNINVRQRGEYREFVNLVDGGRIQEAFQVPGIMEKVKQMDALSIPDALAKDYVEALQRKKTVAAVAPTNKECDLINESIHRRMKEVGLLGEARKWEVLKNLGWTQAQRRDEAQYKPGLVVQFNKHVKGFALGERVEVIDVREDVVRVRVKEPYKDMIRKLPLDRPETFNVYERGQIEVCAGEEIRVTCNTKTLDGHRLENGNNYRVDYYDHNRRMVLENGWLLDEKFVHFKYGYGSTSHVAQGATVDEVFLMQVGENSTPASDRTQFYVSTSRGRDDFRMYTDNLELVMEDVQYQRPRPMATELLLGKASELAGTQGKDWAGKREELEELMRQMEHKRRREEELRMSLVA